MLRIKQYGVWLALALTLLAAWWVSLQESADKIVGLANIKHLELKQITVQPQKNARLVVNDDALLHVNNDEHPQNIFTVLVSPTAQSTVAEHVTPAMPANPFIYAGKIIDGTQVTVFLINGEKSYAVKVGDVLDEVWQIKAIKPSAITLRYLPLKTELPLDIGVVN
ncbi:MAG: hypothetical protein CTY37_00110 [Methylotenera sp.]|nr:MAG: hypothetical protein CTY37_00110 [Methylotenera sp.]